MMHLLWSQLQTCRLARALSLDLAELRSQPAFKRFLQLRLIVVRFQNLDSRSCLIQRNEVAGNCFRLVFRRNEIEQVAFTARMGAVRIAVIEATERVLKDGFWRPRRANRSAISALLDEVEFLPQNFENISVVFSHGNQTSSSSLSLNVRQPAAALVRLKSDSHTARRATNMPRDQTAELKGKRRFARRSLRELTQEPAGNTAIASCTI